LNPLCISQHRYNKLICIVIIDLIVAIITYIKTIYSFPDMPEANEVVISGISGRFPECNSTEEFKQKLYNNADLLTVDNRRWSPGKLNFRSVVLFTLIGKFYLV